MEFKDRTLGQIADMICGNFETAESHFRYRSSSYLTEFFEDCDAEYRHDGSTRKWWVVGVLREILAEPQPAPNTPSETFARVIRTLMDQSDALNEGPDRPGALSLLNTDLAREGFEAFYADDRQCYLRHIATNTIATPSPNPHRPFSPSEIKRREQLTSYLRSASDALASSACPEKKRLRPISSVGATNSISPSNVKPRNVPVLAASRCCADPPKRGGRAFYITSVVGLGRSGVCSLGPRPDIPRYAFSLPAAGGVVTRRGAIGAAGMLLTSISGIGRSRKPRTALASSL